ncbi:MAG: elongation factor P [Sulfuricurvum sp. PC08-66]|nr:MAG: elongation factor P [Sulfuricurvum sp. PC08-66]
MALTYSMSDLKKGLKIEIDGIAYRIVDFQHVKPGKGAAFVRTKIKKFADGRVIDKTFHAGDKCQQPEIVTKEMQFLYDDGEARQFMDVENYEQIALSYDQTDEAAKWILDGMSVDVLFHNGVPLTVDAKATVELKIVDTPPNFKGDTSSGSRKPATLETGAVVQVPYHILEGDVIKINTIDGEYIEKVK